MLSIPQLIIFIYQCFEFRKYHRMSTEEGGEVEVVKEVENVD